MKQLLITLAAISLVSCSRSYKYEDHLDETKRHEIMVQLVTRIEKRFTEKDVIKQAPMDSMWVDSCYIHSLTKKGGRYYFLYIQKDVYSEPDDARAVIGSFIIDENDSLISVYQDYITHRTSTSTAINNGTIFLERHVKGQSLDEYLNKKGLIQWPNDMVKFNYETEKWEY